MIKDTNLFEAVGFPDPDILQIKQEAVKFLRSRLLETGMSQAELARRAELEPSHVSEMLASRLTRFGIDRLNRALGVFGSSIVTSYSLRVREAA